MKKYGTLFFMLLLFSIKTTLSYRFSLVFKILHGPVYVGVLYTILNIAFSRTDMLGGWSKHDAVLMFFVYQFIYANCLIFFIGTIRHFLWQGIRLGEVDTWLLKPGSTQFYLTFSRPETDLLALWVLACIGFIYQLGTQVHTTFINLLSFWVLFMFGHVIVYLSLSIYSTLGFFVSRAQQIVEMYDKASDFSQYPLHIFPISIQFLLTAILPTAFFSYVPTLFLLSKGSVHWLLASGCLVLLLYFINKFAWKEALKHYSSASS